MDFLWIYGILLVGTLRSTTAVLSTDVIEYSIAVKLVTKTISYQQATLNCKSDGKELCSSQIICNGGKIPYNGVIPGDHWVPVADSTNEWIQIGNSPHPPCKLHSALGSKPPWGLKNGIQNAKGYLYCCKIKRKEDSITIKAANTISYQQGLANCQADGKGLCTSKQLCKDDKTPLSGPLYGDHWVPVKDSYNEWLQIGNAPHKPCTLHSKLGSKPKWGVTTSRHSFKGFLFCCKK